MQLKTFLQLSDTVAVCYHTKRNYTSALPTPACTVCQPQLRACRNQVQKGVQSLITFMPFDVPCYMTHRGGGAWVPLDAG